MKKKQIVHLIMQEEAILEEKKDYAAPTYSVINSLLN